jgi:chromosome partitioning protein
MVKILAFTNNKGGTGKSTLCVNTAHVVARTGAKVLVIDLTSQRTSSTALLGETETLTPAETILSLLKRQPDRHIEDLIFESEKGMDVVCSHISMADAVLQLAAIPIGKERILQRELVRLGDQYDYIFIDSPGDLNELTANALVAADRVFIPTRLNRTDFQCTETTIRFIREAESYIGERTVRVVLNMLDDRYLPGGIWSAAHTGQLYQQAHQIFRDVLSPVTIPDSSDIRTAFDRGLTVIEYKPDTAATQRLQELVKHEVFCD